MTHARRPRVLAYDLLRVVAAVTVVVIHVLAAHLSQRSAVPATDWALVGSRLLHYAVPLFTFLSGALTWGAPWTGVRGAYRSFLRKRWSTVGLPYLVWTVVFLLLRPLTGQVLWVSGGVVHGMRQVIIWVVNGTAWYHLYYLPMILAFYTLTPLAARAFRRVPELALASAIAITVVWTDPILALVAQLPLNGAYRPLVVNMLAFLPYMALGAWFEVRRERVRTVIQVIGIAVATLGGVASALVTLGLWIPAGALTGALVHVGVNSAQILGLAGAALAVTSARAFDEGRSARFRLHALAHLTFGVYIVHPLVLLGFRRIVGLLQLNAPYDSWWLLAALGVLVTGTSFFVAAVLRRSRIAFVCP